MNNAQVSVATNSPVSRKQENREKKVNIIRNQISQTRIELSKSIMFKLYIFITFCLALAEPFLVSFAPTGLPFKIQIAVLILSTFFFFVGIILTALYYKDPYVNNSCWYGIKKLFKCFDGEDIFELVFLSIGNLN